MIGTKMMAGFVVLTSCAVFAQPAAPLKFEVASVKRVNGGGPPGDIPRNLETSPGHFTMRNVPLSMLLKWAYDLKDYELSGPDWITVAERYDVIAKAAGEAPEAEMRQMLQTLLVERFQMKVHRESKEMPVYVLMPGKGETKVKPATNEDQPTISGGPTGAFFHNQPISRFTFMLTRRMDRPVLDQTGLKGRFDFTVDLSGLGFAGRDVPAGAGDAGPSIFTTVQRDLGLKLDARKEAIDILVIDAVNKEPIAN